MPEGRLKKLMVSKKIKKCLLWIVKLRLSWIVSIVCSYKYHIVDCPMQAELGLTHQIKVSREQKYWLQISTPRTLQQICFNQKFKCKYVSTPLLKLMKYGDTNSSSLIITLCGYHYEETGIRLLVGVFLDKPCLKENRYNDWLLIDRYYIMYFSYLNAVCEGLEWNIETTMPLQHH